MSLGLILDLPGALVKLYQTIRMDRELQDWVRLILSCVFSGFLGLTGTWGALLMAHEPSWYAFGGGLCMCSVGVLTVLLRMPQGRSLMIAAPTETVKQYQSDNQTVINPTDK